MSYEKPRCCVFGTWDAPATDGDQVIPTPVGNTCIWCQEKVKLGDNGRIDETNVTQHRECSLRSVLGGIGHHVDHARYCRSTFGPDAGLSRRMSSVMVWEFLHETQLNPTPEQLSAWQEAVRKAREEHG